MERMIKIPFTGYEERTSELLGLVHINIYDPMTTQTKGGYSYLITFTDDLSRFRYVYLMKYKFKIFDKFKEYQSMVEK